VSKLHVQVVGSKDDYSSSGMFSVLWFVVSL
jgi:hypothetical protein